MSNAFWQLINQSDFISKLIIIILLCMSVICWAITIYKNIICRVKMKQLNYTRSILEDVNNLDEFLAKSSALKNTYSGQIIAHFLIDFKTALNSYKKDLKEDDWLRLQYSMIQTIENAINHEESSISILSTSAQVSPLIGLFGTVWGLINAFLGISLSRSADISAVAPGIAEALITTLFGLIVAIPAVVMFNYLQNKIKMLEQRIIAMADKCYWIMRSVYIKPAAASPVREIFDQAPHQADLTRFEPKTFKQDDV